MNVSCPECSSVFRVDPRKVPLHGVRARCSVCGGVLSIARGGSIDAEFDAIGEESKTQSFTSYDSFFGGESASGTAASAPVPAEEPVLGSGEILHGAAAFEELRPEPRPTYRHATPPGAPLIPPAAPHRLTPSGPRQRIATPPFAGAAQREGAAAFAASAAAPMSSPPSAEGGDATGAAGGGSATPSFGRSRINPYLASDPNLKARRLARVLVSDMVVYHPDKREEGLRSGSLKQLFRDEIKKSYEEYIEQVGKEFAETTAHFQEALNEILAGGKRVF
jgi:predicted Zn finger-like uncharacterized protein